MLRIFTLVIFLQLLGACSTLLMSPEMDLVKDESPEYQDGYKAGCYSGFVAGGSIVHKFKRNGSRFKEGDYKEGWKKAYRQCKDDFREMCKSKALVSKADLYCSDVKQQGLDKDEEK
jgi:hypothetical protein